MRRVAAWVWAAVPALAIFCDRGGTDADARGSGGCLGCHSGIEQVAPHDFGCEVCHRGQDGAADKEAAHQGLVTNPGDLRVAEESCGPCHVGYVSRVKKSLHTTSAGIISGARYLWAAQETKEALYAVQHVADEDGD
ncbi:MAG: hypothetical protein GTN78_24615, partial [Gemmatimonadales bacterium]|nr:hypothetical protein [Gemmatimonadales bacterium]NIR03346.1 hypothetical protein [Gemmatimonadales bacterium]NIS67029.1 hypothetical protein [Gemmatimonadales bacterium]